MLLELASPLAALPGLGTKRAEALAHKHLHSVEDLLWRLPFRWEDRSLLRTIRTLEPGVKATVAVEAVGARLKPTRRRGFSIVEATFRDPSGQIRAVFFNQPYLADELQPGRKVFLFGAVERDGLFAEMKNPQIEMAPRAGEEGATATHAGRVVPIYEKLASLGPRVHRVLIDRALAGLKGRFPEVLPAQLAQSEGLMEREAAFRAAHFPETRDLEAGEPARAVHRLAFEELFVEQLGLAATRVKTRREAGAPALAVDDELRAALKAMLPFPLTAAQRRVLAEIGADLRSPRPMRRLLQGDVGSGKTIVAALALAVAARNGHQAALMAPTELLAEQHAASVGKLLARAEVRSVLLTGTLGRVVRERVKHEIASGAVSVVIGTHAILEGDVRFRDLALAVIDEQHRFGVVQREGLGAKGRRPHVLVMTATPIPRSLALTVYGDLDLSVIDQLPPGRRPVRTVIKTAGEVGKGEAEAYGFIAREVAKGRQAYVVCPLVEESEKSDLKAAEDWAETVAERYFRGMQVGLLHGKMKARDRSRLMTGFTNGEVQVLVGTTVIEVGIDVANASVMLIEHAERFGLSQLHQLRGRIGRGSHPSTCILVVRSKVTDAARARLELMRETSDGFRVAEADLRLRGPGEMTGTRQWGMPSFRVANVLRDFGLLERARAHAARYAADDVWMASAEARGLLAAFEARHRLALVG